MASGASKSEIRSAARSAKDAVGHAADDVARGSAEVVEHANDHIDTASIAGKELYAKSLQLGRDVMHELPADLSDMSAAGERVVRDGSKRLIRGVRQQPVEALLLAGAIGYLVGWANQP